MEDNMWYYRLLTTLQAFLPRTADDDSGPLNDGGVADEVTVAVEIVVSTEMEDRVSMQEETSTPPPASTSGQDQWIEGAWEATLSTLIEIKGTLVSRLHGLMIGGASDAISGAVKLHMGGIYRMQMLEVSTEQSEDGRKNHLKRIYEYTKKAATFEAMLLSAICNQQYLIYSNNTAFKVSLAMLLLAFFTNILSGLLLLNSSNLLPYINYPIYISSVIQMLVPFALLVSSGQLQSYMILISLLPFLFIALFHQESTDANALDHIFDISAGIYALLSAGCALANPYFISKESVAASPLACSLFLTILTARYLMLISTLRPPVIVEHANALMFILKLLLALTLIFVAMEFLGWLLLALVVIFYSVIDGVLFFMALISHSCPRTTRGDKPISDQQRKDQQLLSAVFVGILFMALTQTYAEHAAAQHEVFLGSAAMLRMLLYFVAFMWSINRMLISITAADVVAAPPGGHAAVVWTALEWARASVVAVAALDVIYKFGIAFIVMASN